MKDLILSLSRNGVSTKSLDLGDWDITVGLNRTVYMTNPNTYAKADLKGLKNSDNRLKINLPDEIGPGKTIEVGIKIAGKEFDEDIEEEHYFKNILDKLSGRVVWRTP